MNGPRSRSRGRSAARSRPWRNSAPNRSPPPRWRVDRPRCSTRAATSAAHSTRAPWSTAASAARGTAARSAWSTARSCAGPPPLPSPPTSYGSTASACWRGDAPRREEPLAGVSRLRGDTGGVGMTYSIVARDESTGQLGVGVQTCFLAVGSIAPWARPGVGAVATQAFAELAYGPRCLDALEAGRSPADALAEARAADHTPEVRLVGVLAADGGIATMTGERCVDHAGHVAGEGFTAQANMVSSPDVWGAMAAAFEGSAGPLARRLLAALDAGEAAGGDARGRMSAALLVVEGSPPQQPGAGKVVDLRVDRSEDPLGELARLLDA